MSGTRMENGSEEKSVVRFGVNFMDSVRGNGSDDRWLRRYTGEKIC